MIATGEDNDTDDGSHTTGNEVDDYGEGATGDDNNNGKGTERRNNQIKATAAAGGNNSHRRSTAEGNNGEDNDNHSRQNCAMGMWALRRGNLKWGVLSPF